MTGERRGGARDISTRSSLSKHIISMLSRSSTSASTSAMFHRRRTSERSAAGVFPTPSNLDSRQRVGGAPMSSVPGNMRGIRRLELRRSMEESHFMAQKARGMVLNPPVDMRLLDYVSDYDRNLMCPICRCPLVDPVVLMDCDHCFCRDCLNQTWTEYQPGGPRGSCPTCRSHTRLAAKGAVNKILINILDELVVKCPKHEDGCDKHLKRAEVQDHINLYCGYAFVECPRQECEQPMRRKDASECLHFGAACFDCHEHMFVDNLEDHWRRDCPDRKILCPHCQNLVYYRTLNAHTKESCPAITTPCPGSPFGCAYRSTRSDLSPHTTACVFALLAPVFSAQQTRLDNQEKANKLLNRKLNVLERGFERVEKLVLETTPPPSLDPDKNSSSLDVRASRLNQSRHRSRETHISRSASQGPTDRVNEHGTDTDRDRLPSIEFPAPPSGRASTLGHRLSTNGSAPRTRPHSMVNPRPHTILSTSRPQSFVNARPHSIISTPSPLPTPSEESISHPTYDDFALQNIPDALNNYALTPEFLSTPPLPEPTETERETDESYANASPIQHLLSLHENLREEVTRVAGALHELDARHSMLMLNENLRLKEDLAFVSAQVSGLGRQVGWLTSSRLQAQAQVQAQSQSQNQQQGQGQSQGQNQSQGQRGAGAESAEGSASASAGASASASASASSTAPPTTMALRGAARVVQLGGGRRLGSDEGRTKL